MPIEIQAICCKGGVFDEHILGQPGALAPGAQHLGLHRFEGGAEGLPNPTQDYGIVMTDLFMPHMSGFELAREVLALRPGMPVLMTTGYIGTEDVQRAREAGIRELLLKPVTVNELGRVLDRLFHGGEPDGKPSA